MGREREAKGSASYTSTRKAPRRTPRASSAGSARAAYFAARAADSRSCRHTRLRDRRDTGARSTLQSYNEVVLDGLGWNRALPRGIEAFVAVPGDDEAAVGATHRRFLAEFGLSASEVPLLRFRPERDGRGDVFERV